MKLAILTIVLDGQPFIARHLPVFQQLKCNWHWHVAEGAAKNTHCTSWCQKQKPRLSQDGTTEYLGAIDDERVTIHRKKLWDGKLEMFNTMLDDIHEPCVLMQIDSDEIWTAEQLSTIVRLFTERQQLSSIMFPCRYYVGERLILRGENCYGDFHYEWLRAWRYTPGRRFISHEPPVLEGDDPAQRMSKNESRALGLVFDHHAYATEAQCELKQKFYGYHGLVNQWWALQRHFVGRSTGAIATLSRFFPHVKGELPEIVKI